MVDGIAVGGDVGNKDGIKVGLIDGEGVGMEMGKQVGD